MKTNLKRWLSLFMVLALVFSLTSLVYAEDITPGQEQTSAGYTYTAPTAPMAVDDSIITASAHRAASPAIDIMGLNATSGFGMINGGAPADFATAQKSAALGIWGTGINSSPDPYYWNYFYNYYAEENGLEKSADALVNTNAAASPVAADGTLVEEYGNVSVSLSSRPAILLGCASSNGGSDTNGYDEQLATIHSFTADSPYYQEGDETYSPQLVSYQTTTIRQMIESMYRLANAVDAVKAETGKTTRYGDPQVIASDYENFIYGMIAYVHEELAAKGMEPKTFAFVTKINEDGTYEIGGANYNSATSLGRAYEYGISVATPLATETKNVTLDELLEADAIITLNNSNISQSELLESFGDKVYEGITISNSPSALYGVTMNSVENANGYAFVIGSLYSDVIDINPVELCAYFYNHFLHISDLEAVQQVVSTNFADTILPAGVTTTLPTDFSAEKIEALLVKGMQYYSANETYFDAEQFEDSGINDWTPDYEKGIGEGQAPAVTALEIYTQEGKNGEPVLVKAYMTDELAALAETKEDGYGYMYYQKGDAKAVAATEYVALDALFSDAGVTFAEGDKLAFVCDDGPYTKGDFSYETMAVRGVDGDGNPVPTAVAISWNNGSLSDGTVADIAATAKNTGSLRFVSGMTAEEREGQSAAGNRMPSGVVSITVVSPVKIAFTDLSQDWYKNAVAWAVDNGVTNGTSTTTFDPDGNCLREQVVTFLWRAANSPEPASAENPFTDVEEGTPYYKAILWAAENGITTGINKEGTLFDPTGAVTRAQFVTFLYRMQKVEGVSGNNPFVDVPAGQFYTDPVIWAAENHITTGTNSAGDAFTPNGTVTRGQAVTFLYRALG